jgi:hypothetical protein
MARNFRQWFRWAAPSWLSTGEGELVMHSLSLVLDASLQRMRDGLTVRFPEYCGESGLALHGKSRGIQRGRAETDAHYAQRLIAWRHPRGHRVRGSAFALLDQVSEYFGGAACWSVDAKGNRHTHDAHGVEAFSYNYPWDWDDRPATDWSRFWLVIDGSAFEADAVFEDVRAMRRLMVGLAWRPAGTQPEWMIVQDSYGPITLTEPPTLTATWQHWSAIVDGVQIPTRSTAYRYWSLDPAWNNTYAGHPDNFAAAATMADGSTYAGDPLEFPASALLPNGSISRKRAIARRRRPDLDGSTNRS